jgi:hypothetical protein
MYVFVCVRAAIRTRVGDLFESLNFESPFPKERRIRKEDKNAKSSFAAP